MDYCGEPKIKKKTTQKFLEKIKFNKRDESDFEKSPFSTHSIVQDGVKNAQKSNQYPKI
jgi:hypothetical protein